MNQEPPLALVDADRARQDAERLYNAVLPALAGILPSGSDIRHVGATAVPGCLTKGDLDIVVRVPAEDFAAADASLAARFQRNEGSIRTETFSAFEDASCRPHLGIQLVVIDGPLDFFHLFVDALMGSPRLVHAYNALKKRHEGRDMAEYREAKDRFVEQVLADARSSAHPL